ncbi:hypothetical protein, partial [Ascidiimonas aurantiaca]|uniref:hypothetical protein n=1 Tax=Ascidiimonas aurantiaca TaxID=1685432 RepID=UPI0030ECC3FD
MMKTNLLSPKKLFILACFFIVGYSAVNAQTPVPPGFEKRFETNIKGDVTFLANGIINRANVNNPSEANNPYNGTGNNNSFNVEYIDIDGDPSTFSSSSSTLNLDGCTKIAYAALYWSAVYPFDRGAPDGTPGQTGSALQYIGDGNGRSPDFTTVKFRVPGGAYTDVTADIVRFDGFNSADPVNSFKDAPYVCVADVTSLITPLANPNGEYFVANMRAARGRRLGGSAAGWVLVVVYENPTLPGRYITTFDGYNGVQGRDRNGDPDARVEIDVAGFTTIPIGPVRTRLGVAALEGDRGISNDELRIKAFGKPASGGPDNDGFIRLSNAANPGTNFFNSNITIDGANVTTRNIASTNTLGFDADIFDMNNPGNSVIGNGETAATLRLITNGDGYGAFLSTFSIEIIEPEIALAKTVEDAAGNDIGGAGVTLGQEIVYVLKFQNRGNDDATNYRIRDVLPVNVNFPPNGALQPGDIILPPPLSATEQVTYTFDAANNTLEFFVPDGYVEIGDPEYEIRMKVRVVSSCNELRDACSNLIQNQAFSYYQGIINDNQISDDPSFAGFDDCDLGIPGSTNFLTDIDDCSFERDEVLCGSEVVLTAGSGFINYTWRDSAGNILQDGPGNTLTVNQTGTYIVTKTAPAPCLSFDETINVVLFGTTATNPVIPYADEVVTCPNDGDELPKIFLCGGTDSRFIDTEITDSDNIVWQRLDESSCPAVGIDDCANKNQTCTWVDLKNGNDFNVNAAGQYRLVINYQNGCFNRFYFNVSQNLLTPGTLVQDIVCNTPGQITVTNVPSDYEYSLDPSGPFQDSPVFNVTTAGLYTVYIRQKNVSGNICVFTASADVRERNFTVDLIPGPIFCDGDLGSVRVQINDVEPQYYYEISQGGTTIDTFGPSNNNDYTFNNLPAGTYTVNARTDDGCTFTGDITIEDFSDLDLQASVIQDISCEDGLIELTASGGQSPYNYAIWSYNGTDLYTTIGDIPADQFQTSNQFVITAGNQGTYEFVVVDNNNCSVVSNPVTINVEPDVVFTPVITDVSCAGLTDGSVTINITQSHGFTLSYDLTDTSNNVLASNTTGVFTGLAAGNYIVVINQQKGPASCPLPVNVTINDASPLTGQAQIDQFYTCNTPDGIVSIVPGSVSGGTVPYEYSINGVNFSGNTSFSGLLPGVYTIFIRDANGCVFQTNTLNIPANSEPTDLTFTVPQVTCNNGKAVDVTAVSTGGVAPLTYEILAPTAAITSNTTGNFTGLTPDTYTFRVTDTNGCSYTENLTIGDITEIDVTGQLIRNISCDGDSDGELLFTVNSPNTFDYVVTGPNNFSGTLAPGNNVPLNGLSVGTYTIEVTDTVTNCTDITSITINGPPSPLSVSIAVTDKTCTNDGSVLITATGGWGSYEYQLDLDASAGIDFPYQSNNTFSALTTSGSYTVTVRDANGCEIQDVFTLTDAVSPALDLTANDVCYDASAGLTLTATVTSGGTAPFQYRLNGGAYQTGNVFAGLSPGSYTVEVIDNKNCTDTASITINPALTASAVLTKDLDCSVSPDAVININAANGYPAYSYEVSFNAGAYTSIPSATFTTITPGDYTFRVTDAQGCQAITNPITVTPAELPQANATVTNPVSCDAGSDGEVTITVDTNFGTPPYLISFNGSAFSAQTVYAGLAPGTYSYTVRDSKLCEDTFSVTINPANPITATAVIDTPYTCLVNGAITIAGGTASGGTGTFEYSIDGVNFQPSPLFSNLTDGTYTITVRDIPNGCIFVTNPVTLDPLNPPTDLTFAAAPVQCPALTTDVTVTVVDGNAPFTYEIIAPITVNNGNADTFTALAPGTYTFRVTDDKGCTIEESYTINNITPITVNAQLLSDEVCDGANDGSIRFTVANFTGSYDFEVRNAASTIVASGTSSNTTETITGLAPDDYTVTVTDLSYPFCNDTAAAVTVAGPPAALAFTTNLSPLTCIDDALLTVNATGGWGTYEYQLDNTATAGIDVPFQTNNTFPALNAGTYDISVRDVRGCVITQPLTIDPPVNPTVTIAPDTFCFDAATGITITATPAGGIAPYEFSLNGGAFQSANTFAGLAPGTYTVEVRDAYGCTGTSAPVTINPALAASAVLTKDLDCSVSPDAVININAANGYPAYSYEVSFNAGAYTSIPSATFTTITPGDYTFRVTDAQGCQAITNPITVTPAELPQANATVTNPVSCDAGSDGEVTITVDTNFGTPPYLISFNGSAFSAQTVYAGLAPGTYSYTVRDSKLCEDTFSVTINPANPITATAVIDTPYTCLVNGAITIAGGTASGGTGTFEYSIDGVNFQPSPLFSNLTDGTYTITVRDIPNGCIFVTNPVTLDPLNPPTDLTFAAAPVQCPALTTDVTVTVVDGNAPFTYEIIAPITVNNGNADTFTALAPGTYTFRVTDDKGCTIEESYTINNITPITVNAQLLSDEVCDGANDGSIRFTVANFTGSYDFEVRNAASTIVASGTSSNTTETITGLAPDDYTVTVTDLSYPFCNDTAAAVTVAGPPAALAFTTNLSPLTCIDDALLTVNATGGWGTYEYQLDNTATAGIDVPFQTNNTFPALNAGTYDISVRDVRGCVITQPLTIDPPVNPTVTIAPDTFCFDAATGITITATPAGGIAPYEFSLNGGAFQSANTFAGLAPGTYTVEVRDAYGCTGTSAPVTINPALTASAVLTKDLDCSASPDAVININAANGYPVYSYEVSFNAGAYTSIPSATFATNNAGNYTFRVTDSQGCQAITNPITVTPADIPVISNVVPTNILCNGDLTGALDVTINTAIGVPPYTIEVLNVSTAFNYGTQTTGLPAGNYEVRVTDNKGCISAPFPVTISQPDGLVANVVGNPLSCDPVLGNQLGSVDIVITTPSTPNYTYTLLDNTGALATTSTANPTGPTAATSLTFAGVDFGDYTVVIDDGNGCQTTYPATVATGPDVLLTTSGAAGCTLGSGEMTVVAQANNGILGTGNFYFAIFPAPPFSITSPAWFPASSITAPATVPNTFTFTGLTPGVTYTFIVRDDDTNCEYIQEATVPVAAQSQLVSTVAPTDVSCNGAADGSVTFTVDNYDGGATSIDYQIYTFLTNTVVAGQNGSISPLSGGLETVNNFGSLSPGEYYILFTEVGGANNGCVIASDPFVISESPNLLVVNATATNDNCNPNAGVITASAQFGTAPYEYQFLLASDPAPLATDPGWNTTNVANVEADSYIVYARDANNCVQQTPVTVNLDPEPVITATVIDQCTAAEGAFTIEVNRTVNGIAPYTYRVDGGAPQTNNAATFTITNLSSGTHTIEVIDANGCGNLVSLDIYPPLTLQAAITAEVFCSPAGAG